MSTTHSLYGRKLDPRRREIRLLTLNGGEYSTDLSCSLSVASLDDNPSYDALSYVWGSTDEPRTIEVNCTPFTVTKNLDIALRHIRHHTNARTLWIDALCINQNHVVERNSQVRLMGGIYHSAEQVLVWLGEADESSNTAFDLIPTIDVKFLESEEASTVWSFFANATRRPYMSRVWVIQEFVLARQDPLVICGQKSITWSSFMSAYKILALEFFTEIDMVQNDAFEGRVPEVLAKLKYDLFDELRSTVNKDDGADLRQLLLMSRTSESTEPRDRIYGLLQMLEEEDRNHLDVDYNKPTATIFAEAMKLIFKHGDGPHFLGGMWCPSKLNPSIPNLPSWVPDFTSQTSEKAAPYPSNGSFHPPFPRSVSGVGVEANNGKVLDDLKTLKVEALHVDLVEDVLHFSGIMEQCVFQLGEVEQRAETARLCSINNPSLRPFFESYRISEPLWRTLISDKKFASGYHAAPDSYEAMYQQLRSQNSYPNDESTMTDYQRALQSHLPNHTFFTTKWGLVGLGMPDVRKGDEVTIWPGSTVPFIVRTCEHDATKCMLVGAAYVAGIMEGQVVDELYCEDLIDTKTLFVV